MQFHFFHFTSRYLIQKIIHHIYVCNFSFLLFGPSFLSLVLSKPSYTRVKKQVIAYVWTCKNITNNTKQTTCRFTPLPRGIVSEGVVFRLSVHRVRSSSHSSGQILWPRYLRNGFNNFGKTDRKYSAAPNNDRIRFWKSNVKGLGHRRSWRRHPRRHWGQWRRKKIVCEGPIFRREFGLRPHFIRWAP